MFKYILSDLHLGHGNIIEYCNRPFNTAEEMDSQLIHNWNSVVSDTDPVLYLGDLTLAPPEVALEYLEQLNGQIIMIQGNHDRLKMQDTDNVQIVDSLVFTYRGIKFHAVHEPYNMDNTIPNQWLLHGHTHNNELEQFPFFNPSNQTINLSVELVNYTPVKFDRLVNFISDKSPRMEHIE